MVSIFCIGVADGGLEWDNATEIAFCKNRQGYQKDGERAAKVLRDAGISTAVIFFINIQGVRGVTEDKNHADQLAIFVTNRDAAKARTVLAASIREGLPLVLVESKQKHGDK
jgi:hypothetical protein